MSQLFQGRSAHLQRVLFAVTIATTSWLVACGGDEFASVGVSELSVTPDVLGFSATEIGAPDAQFLTITNLGEADLVITELDLRTSSDEFTLEDAPTPFTLGPSQDRVIQIVYTPSDCSSDRGNLIIRSNDTEVEVPLQPSPMTGVVNVRPNPIDFQRVIAGTHKTIPVTVANIGTCELTINDLFLSGSADFHFSEAAGEGWSEITVDSQLPLSLAPATNEDESDEITVDVTYAPTNDGFDEGSLVIRSDNALVRTLDVPIVANGDQACIVVSEEPLIDYGERFIGDVHAKTVTITNCSQREDLFVSSITLGEHWAEGGAERYTLADLPDLSEPLQLAPAESESFIMNYTPVLYTPDNTPGCELQAGQDGCPLVDGAVLTVESNDEVKSPLDIEVTGIGTNNHCPVAIGRARPQGSAEAVWDTQLDTVPLVTLEFDGRGSSDQEGDISSYQWEVSNRPPGSVATFAPNAQVPNPTFFLDLAGTFVFSLRVFDETGTESCDPAEITAIVTPNEAIHVQLVWRTPADPDETDTDGSDVDLHFMHPHASASWNELPWDNFWRNVEPNWGGPGPDDNPSLDIDDTNGAGPENINLNEPEGDGTNAFVYKVGVHYFSDHGWGPADPTVRIFINGVRRFEATFPGLLNRQFWDVARISWPSGEIERIHRLYPSGFPG